jgi:hypothetical protein
MAKVLGVSAGYVNLLEKIDWRDIVAAARRAAQPY